MFSMNTVSLPHRASPAEAAFEAAVVRGVALIGVLKGFTRRVFGLGRVMKQVLVRLDQEGVDPHSANSGFDLTAVLNRLSRALHLADALYARLRTPAVTLALLMLRPRSAPRCERIAREVEDEDYDPEDPLRRISYGRGDEKIRSAYREAIEDMSDGEVVDHIISDLIWASAMLGETEEGARVVALAHKAAGLFATVKVDAAPDEVAPGHPDYAMSDGGSDRSDGSCARPTPPAVGRGPP
jgi:hypothetical protein